MFCDGQKRHFNLTVISFVSWLFWQAGVVVGLLRRRGRLFDGNDCPFRQELEDALNRCSFLGYYLFFFLLLFHFLSFLTYGNGRCYDVYFYGAHTSHGVSVIVNLGSKRVSVVVGR